MNLDAPTYFAHLRAYVNDHYVMHGGDGGEVVLREKYFPPPPATRAKTRKLRLLLPWAGSRIQARPRSVSAAQKGEQTASISLSRRQCETLVETLPIS